MEHRRLGRTGLTPSILGFGTAPLGDVFGKLDEREAIAAVHAAIDAGIDWFDTAPLYGFGLAEERLGKALAGRRDRVFVATKCCRDGFERFDFSAARVAASLDESLRRLRSDHVDLFQIHDVEFGDREQILFETIPAALRLKASGKVRAVGITGLPVRYLRALAEHSDVDVVMSWANLNLLVDDLDTELAPLARLRDFGLISASPLLQGLLSERAPPSWHRSPAAVKALAPRLAAECRAAGTDLASVAIRYALEYPHVASTILGLSSRAELEAALAALARPIPDGLLERLAAMTAPAKNQLWFEGRPENNLAPRDARRAPAACPLVSHA